VTVAKALCLNGQKGDALVEHEEHTNMKPKNTICLWFDEEAHEAARFYAATFPDSKVTAVYEAPRWLSRRQEGRVLTVEFTVEIASYGSTT
jgi:predicted 3-demethylubiquinone-9 3-methyltransferase (glyoxalase superfamily)